MGHSCNGRPLHHVYNNLLLFPKKYLLSALDKLSDLNEIEIGIPAPFESLMALIISPRDRLFLWVYSFNSSIWYFITKKPLRESGN